jgi:enamine deaminase RidA (YjgF/YER057c/UK114 family)
MAVERWKPMTDKGKSKKGVGMFFAALFLMVALCDGAKQGRASRPVQRLLVPGAAGVSSWFSTVTYVEQAPLVFVYVSGTIGSPFPSPRGPPHLVPGGIGNQTRQALSNIMGAVNYTCQQVSDDCEHDWRWSLTKCRVYSPILSTADAAAFDAAWVAFFADPVLTPPARMAFQGASLVVGALVEIECDAVISQ